MSNVKSIDEMFEKINEEYKCPYCGKLRKKKGIRFHVWKHTNEGKKFNPFAKIKKMHIWNKGFTKENNNSIKHISESLKQGYLSGELIPSFKNKKHSNETKNNISNKMIIAHKEGRAWNIGKSRWNNKPSEAEQQFINFLNNINIKFEREYAFDIYSADFYFSELKLVIEIDGRQHKRFKEYQQRDHRKNELIKSFGINILRIDWSTLCNNSKYLFQKIKDILLEKIEIKHIELLNEFTKTQAAILIKGELNGKLLPIKTDYIKCLQIVLKKVLLKKIYDSRLEDIKQINISKFGAITYLSNKWKVSHTQVRRFIKKYYNKPEIIVDVAELADAQG